MVFLGFVVFVVVVYVATVAVLGVIVVVAVVFLFVVVVVVKIAVVVVIVFVRRGVGALVIRVGVQVGIISMTPGGFILLVDFDDEIVHGELHHRNGFCHAYGKHIGLCTNNMAFVIVLETILISMVSSTLSISKLTSTIIVPMITWHGPRYGCGHSMSVCLICLAWAVLWLRCPMGVCLICLAWAALRLRPPYGRVLSMFGMGRPMVARGPHDRGIRNRKGKRKATSKSED